ncbi:NnrS family protein [Rhodovulum sp. YNF3179]|uniref:NnrS family protein n=1 Tax=Rhodovulum sp. YNF3179 TaxID=3425127 RepID=UPI003D3590C4
MQTRQDFTGPALFSYGFRPFFLAATLFGLGVVPAWLLVWRGDLMPGGPMAPVDWHVHEMIFGYGAAVVAGFLFTAVPNWTGRMPARGWPLAVLLALWIAGRLAMAGAFGDDPVLVMCADGAFLLAVAGMIAREIVAGRNWRNLKVVVPVSLLAAANVFFHLEAMRTGLAETGHRLGIALLVFLIMLIGGRIVPSFTRNWLARSGSPSRPVPFGPYDVASLVAGGVALAGWVAVPDAPATGVALALATVMHVVRLARWLGVLTAGAPLLVMLHIAYGFLPAGFAAAALGAFGRAGPDQAAHLFGIGGIGGMTLAVMMRATLGHTGRPLVAGPALTVGFVAVALAALVRLYGADAFFPGLDGIHLAALLWTAGFALAVRRLLPWLATPRMAPRRPGRASLRT